ncbi:bifunctional diguanylate cyclase/phosphodiesterase [Ureibacillus chungkukjangi]|uniref:EAL domain-containing protein (Putative c-di-GMP-specific phosphodiesterase class I) n=1 Tax=Ureibacillus chungkukjangi TaxID=1202712 RepID=A0A318TSW9_9BACL|nr:EAL domain-containing protein [Ureibacillus chungkukjangi]PYF07946.1 EAL domain-containing protein (putative c-di-GMP-specific phosphodiesterase class I) [Ureibacillus chungkukjangi]
MFSIPDSQGITILYGEYSVPLIVLSVFIACFASYAALFMNQRIQDNGFFPKSFWLILSSVAMGLGIWSMHFIGMSAFMLPLPMDNDLFLTILSMLPAIIASYIAFNFANKSTHQSLLSYSIVGMIMGLGIASMHYLGMAAMKMEAMYYYKPTLFVLSIIIAIVVSMIAMFVFATLQKHMNNHLIKIITAILLGIAISSMHYTGMASVVFYIEGPFLTTHHMHDFQMDLSVIVIVALGLLFIIVGLTRILERFVDYRLNYYDALTLFPNQRQFEKDTNDLKTTGSLAILQIQDLEKWINQYGYVFGDKVIKAVGEVIENNSKSQSFKLYRIEGNRFAVYAFNDQRFEKLKGFMESITDNLKNPIQIEDYPIVVDIVCAISTSKDKENVLELLANNLAVLHYPSSNYIENVIEFDPKIHTYNMDRQIVEDLEKAMVNNELFLVYQPKVQSHSRKISGLEALVRWKHPQNGMIPPGVFIPIVEAAGNKVFDLTDWIIEHVCIQISQWLEEGIEFEQVSINIPGSYITSTRLYEVINTNLDKYNVDSSYIELEITETSVVYDIKHAITAINRFREIGLSVALDDFGTGLSSLSYLKRMPISTIKIDKSFVDGISNSEKDSAVLKSIITLSDSLNLKIVIEGVETEEQYNFIYSMEEAPLIQGYYFSRPLTSDEFINWAKERK